MSDAEGKSGIDMLVFIRNGIKPGKLTEMTIDFGPYQPLKGEEEKVKECC